VRRQSSALAQCPDPSAQTGTLRSPQAERCLWGLELVPGESCVSGGPSDLKGEDYPTTWIKAAIARHRVGVGELGRELCRSPMIQRWYCPVIHGNHSMSGRWGSAGRQRSGGRARRCQGDGKSDVVKEQCAPKE
jgi:hypothetical protein